MAGQDKYLFFTMRHGSDCREVYATLDEFLASHEISWTHPAPIREIIEQCDFGSSEYIIGPWYHAGDFQLAVTGKPNKDESLYEGIHRELGEEVGATPNSEADLHCAHTAVQIGKGFQNTWHGWACNMADGMTLNSDVRSVGTNDPDYDRPVLCVVHTTEAQVLSICHDLPHGVTLWRSTDVIVGLVAVPIRAAKEIVKMKAAFAKEGGTPVKGAAGGGTPAKKSASGGGGTAAGDDVAMIAAARAAAISEFKKMKATLAELQAEVTEYEKRKSMLMFGPPLEMDGTARVEHVGEDGELLLFGLPADGDAVGEAMVPGEGAVWRVEWIDDEEDEGGATKEEGGATKEEDEEGGGATKKERQRSRKKKKKGSKGYAPDQYPRAGLANAPTWNQVLVIEGGLGDSAGSGGSPGHAAHVGKVSSVQEENVPGEGHGLPDRISITVRDDDGVQTIDGVNPTTTVYDCLSDYYNLEDVDRIIYANVPVEGTTTFEDLEIEDGGSLSVRFKSRPPSSFKYDTDTGDYAKGETAERVFEARLQKYPRDREKLDPAWDEYMVITGERPLRIWRNRETTNLTTWIPLLETEVARDFDMF